MVTNATSVRSSVGQLGRGRRLLGVGDHLGREVLRDLELGEQRVEPALEPGRDDRRRVRHARQPNGARPSRPADERAPRDRLSRVLVLLPPSETKASRAPGPPGRPRVAEPAGADPRPGARPRGRRRRQRAAGRDAGAPGPAQPGRRGRAQHPLALRARAARLAAVLRRPLRRARPRLARPGRQAARRLPARSSCRRCTARCDPTTGCRRTASTRAPTCRWARRASRWSSPCSGASTSPASSRRWPTAWSSTAAPTPTAACGGRRARWPSGGSSVRVLREVGGERSVVSHMAKHTRGLVARHLVSRTGRDPVSPRGPGRRGRRGVRRRAVGPRPRRQPRARRRPPRLTCPSSSATGRRRTRRGPVGPARWTRHLWVLPLAGRRRLPGVRRARRGGRQPRSPGAPSRCWGSSRCSPSSPRSPPPQGSSTSWPGGRRSPAVVAPGGCGCCSRWWRGPAPPCCPSTPRPCWSRRWCW